jgi:hypothetical protein
MVRLMNKAIYLVILLLIGCSSTPRYPNWQYVRVEKSLPSENCVYKVQDACAAQRAAEGCFNWFKKRATIYNANTVILTGNVLVEYQTSDVVISQEVVAEYYACPTKEDQTQGN